MNPNDPQADMNDIMAAVGDDPELISRIAAMVRSSQLGRPTTTSVVASSDDDLERGAGLNEEEAAVEAAAADRIGETQEVAIATTPVTSFSSAHIFSPALARRELVVDARATPAVLETTSAAASSLASVAHSAALQQELPVDPLRSASALRASSAPTWRPYAH